LTGNALRVREVQVVEEQLSVFDSNTDNTSDKLPTTRAEKYSEVATEKYYREQNLLPVYFFIENKEINRYVMLKRIVSIL
jgi:hypothetical protein